MQAMMTLSRIFPLAFRTMMVLFAANLLVKSR
jgi:hypothetical protein